MSSGLFAIKTHFSKGGGRRVELYIVCVLHIKPFLICNSASSTANVRADDSSS